MLTTRDTDAINAILRKMAETWAAGDGAAYGDLFWEDANYVEATGNRVTGKAIIAQRHQAIFDSFFKNTRIDGDYKRAMQPLTGEVVLIHGEGNVLFPGETSANVERNGLVTTCLLKRDGVWKIIAFQNTPTGKFRGPKFMWRFFKSRFKGNKS